MICASDTQAGKLMVEITLFAYSLHDKMTKQMQRRTVELDTETETGLTFLSTGMKINILPIPEKEARKIYRLQQKQDHQFHTEAKNHFQKHGSVVVPEAQSSPLEFRQDHDREEKYPFHIFSYTK